MCLGVWLITSASKGVHNASIAGQVTNYLQALCQDEDYNVSNLG